MVSPQAAALTAFWKLSPLTRGSEPVETTTVVAAAEATKHRITRTREVQEMRLGQIVVQHLTIRFIRELLLVCGVPDLSHEAEPKECSATNVPKVLLTE